ncbi:MAG: hypothetical protein ACRDTP_09250 [Mycobacteriales bacterium]
MKVDAVSPEQAVEVGVLHTQLHGHELTVAACDGCGSAIGLLCMACREPLCYIETPHGDVCEE